MARFARFFRISTKLIPKQHGGRDIDTTVSIISAKDTQAYGYAAAFGLSKSCQEEVTGQLIELRRRSANLESREDV